MLNLVKSVLQFPFYLWILGVYPIIHLYLENFGLVRDFEVPPTIFTMILGTSLVYAIAGRAIGDPHRRAFYISLLSLFFSLNGHVYVMIFMPRSLFIWDLATAVGLILFITALHKLLPRHSYRQFSAPFNLIATALLAMQIISLASHVIAAQGYAPISAEYGDIENTGNGTEKVNDSASRPDIYYIIPDGYPSDAWLLSAMNYDNTAFTKALEQRGFVIAPNAQSNYGATIVSMPSVLNMQYFSSNPSDYSDFDYLKWMTANSAVARYLMQMGYTYIQFLSGFIHPSAIADINRDVSPNGPIDYDITDQIATTTAREGRSQPTMRIDSSSIMFRQPFLPVYIDTTSLRLIRSRLEKLRSHSPRTPYDRMSGERFLATIDEIQAVVAMPEATFTVVHFLKPHYPVQFNEQGQLIEPIFDPSHDEYVADFKFANSQFLRLFDTILQGSDNQPVILFQADHGSLYGKPTAAGGRMSHFDIYAAYYLPDSYQLEIPKTFTSVNTFPLILNEVFEADFQTRENRLLEILNYKKPFLQKNVTAEFARN